jgi:ABC-type nitrate/sulfonate/bicarbonate transport system substrate-binding protein
MKKHWLIIMLSLVALAGLGFGQASAGTAPTLERVRFAHAGIDAQRDIFVAQDKGFFETNGLDVKLTKMLPQDLVPAVIGGHLDGAVISDMAGLLALAKGADLKKVFSGAMPTTPEQLGYIGVLKDSPIKTAKDLNGKTIAGHTKGGGVWLYVMIAAKENNIKFSQYVGAPPGQFAPMLIAGKVDSAILQPRERLVVFRDKVREVVPLTAMSKFGINETWFSGKFLKEHPETVRKFVSAIRQAREYERSHQAEVFRITANTKYAYTTFEELKEMREFKLIQELPPEIEVNVWQLKYLHGALLEFGLLDKPLPLDIKEYVDARFARPVWEMPKGKLDWLPIGNSSGNK